jgi:hypothetical protein
VGFLLKKSTSKVKKKQLQKYITGVGQNQKPTQKILVGSIKRSTLEIIVF